jgi:glutaredoxin
MSTAGFRGIAMSKPLAAAALGLVGCLVAAAASAQMYRWVDRDGKVHYTDTPPPTSAGKSAQVRRSGNVVDSDSLPYATQQALKHHPVTIYTADNCKEPCADGRKLLQGRGVPFREVAITDEQSRAELKNVSGGEEVPVITVGKSVTKGFGADSWNLALDAAGYPRSGPALPAQKSAPAAKAAEPAEPPAAEQPKLGPYAPR